MPTDMCDRLGIEFPVFLFSHFRDVVAVINRAGGSGVLAGGGLTTEQLAAELGWTDGEVGGKPYSVGIAMPLKDAVAEEVGHTRLADRAEKHVDATDRLNALDERLGTAAGVAAR
jgi:hypothetical protein